MRPIFTVHCGEYLVADHIEKNYSSKYGLQVWVPSIDSGVDLLVTNKNHRKTVALQVKYSKSYDCKKEFDATGWWLLNRKKIEESKADYWVFVIPVYAGKMTVSDCSFVLLTPAELLRRLKKIHAVRKTYNMYLTIQGQTVIETREMRMRERERQFKDPSGCRNFSCFLNKWDDAFARLLS